MEITGTTDWEEKLLVDSSIDKEIFHSRSSKSCSSDFFFCLPKECFNKLTWLFVFLDSQI